MPADPIKCLFGLCRSGLKFQDSAVRRVMNPSGPVNGIRRVRRASSQLTGPLQEIPAFAGMTEEAGRTNRAEMMGFMERTGNVGRTKDTGQTNSAGMDRRGENDELCRINGQNGKPTDRMEMTDSAGRTSGAKQRRIGGFLKRGGLLFAVFSSAGVWSATVSWSGFARGEFYSQGTRYQHHGAFYLGLKPEVQVMDGLTVSARVDAKTHTNKPLDKKALLQSSPWDRQDGLLLLYNKHSGPKTLSLFQRTIDLSQYYITYEGEFTRFQLGKAPYHFGMGLTYSNNSPAFSNWVSHLTQASILLTHSSYYLRGTAWLNTSGVSPLLAGGIAGEKWNLEGLYTYFRSAPVPAESVRPAQPPISANGAAQSKTFSPHRLEVFGKYEEKSWDTKLSVAYGFSKEELGVAFEAGMNLKIPTQPRLEALAGYAGRDFFFHPNYNVGLLLWNYIIPDEQTDSPTASAEKTSQPVWIEEGRVNDVIYLSARPLFFFLKKDLRLAPQVIAGWRVSKKQFDYEFNLELKYNMEKFFVIRAQGGVFRKKEKTDFGILAQAAVDF